jgi:hypothetical protein
MQRPLATAPGDRTLPARVIDRSGWVVLAMTAAAWAVVMGGVLRHRIFLTRDTMISYAHVWYIAGRLWHGHGLPFHMPVVDHGHGVAYPYGFLPWTAAALIRPVVGDWSVTLALVAGAAAVIAATFWSFPEVRHGWWAAAVLVNPALVTSPLLGQIPFLWASALLLVAIGAWRRGWSALAVVSAGLAQATHPAVVLPLAAAVVIGSLPWQRHRRRLLAAYAVSLLIAAPAVWVVLSSSVFSDTSATTKAIEFIDTLAPRCLVIAVPIVLAIAARRHRPWLGPVAWIALVAATAGSWSPLGMPVAWRGLRSQPDTVLADAVGHDAAFPSDAVYRVLRIGDGKVAMYQVLQHQARLDSDFFPEDIDRRSWSTPDAYAAFLRSRGVDDVVVWRGYDGGTGTDEHALLDRLTAGAGCRVGVSAALVEHTHDYDLYRIDRGCPPLKA